jgi:hypothetical protein
LPRTDAAREELARVIAADGEQLLAAVEAATDQPVLAQLPAVLTLRRVWAEQYTREPGQLRWREVKDMRSPAELISSPYDTEARRCRYIGEAKVHLQHLLTAAAIDVVRLDDWWPGRPVAGTRCSWFAAMQEAA